MSRDSRYSVVELRRRLGSRRPLLRELFLDDVAVGSTFVPADRAVTIDLVAEAVADGVVVDGSVRAHWEGECRRCLERLEGELALDVRELFTEAGDHEETYPIEHDTIDLEPLARDALMLNLPQVPLCRLDCEGPDPARYPAAPKDDTAPVDQRWAALSELDLGD